MGDILSFGQVVVETLKKNVIGDNIDPKAVLNLDSGLGVVDAFFASLSMILVSEVCALFPFFMVLVYYF